MKQTILTKIALFASAIVTSLVLISVFIITYEKVIQPNQAKSKYQALTTTQSTTPPPTTSVQKEASTQVLGTAANYEAKISAFEAKIKSFEGQLQATEDSLQVQSAYLLKLLETDTNQSSANLSSLPQIIQQQKKYVVQVICINFKDGFTNGFGSGVVIGKNEKDDLIVLTNYHVVADLTDTAQEETICLVGAQGETEKEWYYVEPFYPPEIEEEEMAEIDFALLKILTEPRIDLMEDDRDEEDIPSTFLDLNTFPQACTTEQLTIGEALFVLGFPSYSGDDDTDYLPVLTATEGIISEEITEAAYYFNTSAKIEQGNSGGGAFLINSGCYAGIPTFGIAGEIESLGRILNANKLKQEFLSEVIRSPQHSHN